MESCINLGKNVDRRNLQCSSYFFWVWVYTEHVGSIIYGGSIKTSSTMHKKEERKKNGVTILYIMVLGKIWMHSRTCPNRAIIIIYADLYGTIKFRLLTLIQNAAQ